MATVLPGFDRFQGVRGFLDNFVTGILSNQQNQRQLSDQQALLEFIQQSRSGQDPGIPQFATPQGAAGFLSNQQAQPGFTLSPGETRFGPGGQQVASISKGPETRESTSQFTARLGQSILDGTATPGAQKMFERLASSPSTAIPGRPSTMGMTPPGEPRHLEPVSPMATPGLGVLTTVPRIFAEISNSSI